MVTQRHRADLGGLLAFLLLLRLSSPLGPDAPACSHGLQLTSLKLGLPATVTHVIGRGSPLLDLSLADMEASDMELL